MQKSDALEHELEKLAYSPIRELRQQYSSLFAAPPPPAFGPDLLRRSIAQKLQEDLYGGLAPAIQRELGRYAAAKLLGLAEIPTICLAHLSTAQARAYSLEREARERQAFARE
jgi:hypothetical protein